MIETVVAVIVAGMVEVGPNRCQVQILDVKRDFQEFVTRCDLVRELPDK